MGISNLLATIAHRTGGTHLLERIPSRERYLILIYHRVNPDPDPFQMDRVSVGNFDSHVKYLSRWYSVLTVEEILSRIRLGSPLPSRTVAITFDDGYRDNYEYAYPILRKYGAPATVFVATGPVDTGEVLWYEKILDAFRDTEKNNLNVGNLRLAWARGNIEERRGAAFRVLYALLAMDDSRRRELTEETLRVLGAGNGRRVPDRMLTWAQIKEMKDGGIRFGAHSVTHPVLSKVPVAEARSEILRSKSRIEAVLDEEVTTFSFPIGKASDYTPQVLSMVREAGFRGAVTTLRYANHVDDDPYELGRVRPWGDHPGQFGFQLACQLFHRRNAGNRK